MFKKSLFVLFLCMCCVNAFSDKTKYGFECNSSINGNEYFFLDNMETYKCENNDWSLATKNVPYCFSLSDGVKSKPDGLNAVANTGNQNDGFLLYTAADTTNIPGHTNVFKYDEHKDKMCIWCNSSAFGFADDQSMNCFGEEELAWCEFAQKHGGQDVTWYGIAGDECHCNDSDYKFNTETHKCKLKSESGGDYDGAISNTECGVECNVDNLGLSMVCIKNDVAKVFVCNLTSREDVVSYLWEDETFFATHHMNNCPGETGVLYTVSDKPNMTNLVSDVRGSLSKDFFINFDLAASVAINGGTGAYKIDVDELGNYLFDTNKMCFDCEFGEKAYRRDSKDLACGNRAVCLYAKDNGEKVEWFDDGTIAYEDRCICVDDSGNPDADKTFDMENHTCKPKSESGGDDDGKEKKENCDTLYAGQEGALACCKLKEQNQAEMIFESDKTTFKTCECKNNKEWKDNKCVEKASDAPVVSDEPKVPVVSKEDFEAAKSAVDDFFEKADKKASGWKDATGKVNAKRIASDVTAGVVLGTVGGVVSGVVIKKKQIEKGFEVLHCAIGGQSVANWGDTFSVGLKK